MVFHFTDLDGTLFKSKRGSIKCKSLENNGKFVWLIINRTVSNKVWFPLSNTPKHWCFKRLESWNYFHTPSDNYQLWLRYSIPLLDLKTLISISSRFTTSFLNSLNIPKIWTYDISKCHEVLVTISCRSTYRTTYTNMYHFQ